MVFEANRARNGRTMWNSLEKFALVLFRCERWLPT